MQLPYISRGCLLWVMKYTIHELDFGSLSILAFLMVLSSMTPLSLPYLWKDINLFQKKNTKYTF